MYCESSSVVPAKRLRSTITRLTLAPKQDDALVITAPLSAPQSLYIYLHVHVDDAKLQTTKQNWTDAPPS